MTRDSNEEIFTQRVNEKRSTVVAVAFVAFLCTTAVVRAEPWKRHTIDKSSRGADGVRLADVNGDGHQDIATGWEEGGIIRAYLNPGPARSKELWPAVTVGKVKSAEDAVFADLDADGAMDVVSSCEGGTRTVFVHWAPDNPKEYLNPDAWKTEAFPATQKKSWWMFAVPMQVDGKRGIDIVVASKGRKGAAMIGWLESPEDPRKVADWKYHHMQDAGWVMSLRQLDMDSDGHDDIVVSDRRGAQRGTYWLKHPGNAEVGEVTQWQRFDIAGKGQEVMFIDARLAENGKFIDVVTSLRNGHILWSRGSRTDGRIQWSTSDIDCTEHVGMGKAAAIGDVDLDGKPDLVTTFHTGKNRSKPGVSWWSYKESITDTVWYFHDISDSEGVKFDRIELIDLDADGDLDVLTCEEVDQLGVIWYENPTK